MVDEAFKKQIVNNLRLNQILQAIKKELKEKGYSAKESLTHTLNLIEANEVILREFLMNPTSCSPGPLSSCSQPNRGFENQINYHQGKFYLDLTHCNHWKLAHKQELRQKYLIYSDYNLDGFPEDFSLALTLLKEDTSTITPLVNQRRYAFCHQAWEKLNLGATRGIYLSGPSESGKSFLFQILVNCWVAQEQNKVALVRTSNLVNECRDLLHKKATEKYRNLITTLKKVDILFLDEFGAELVSRWSRDEVLLEILNYRCEQKKLTFINSNFALNQLHQHYLVGKENRNLDLIKVNRFLSKIKRLTQEVTLVSRHS